MCKTEGEKSIYDSIMLNVPYNYCAIKALLISLFSKWKWVKRGVRLCVCKWVTANIWIRCQQSCAWITRSHCFIPCGSVIFISSFKHIKRVKSVRCCCCCASHKNDVSGFFPLTGWMKPDERSDSRTDRGSLWRTDALNEMLNVDRRD